jgi:hypothetical protein
MTAYIITEDGRGFAHHGRYTSEDGAIRGLLRRLGGCFEIREIGAVDEPREVTAEWLMANCREVELF